MNDKTNLTVALDFDGVLHSYISGWTGYIPFDPPVPGAVEFVQWLKHTFDAKIYIFSTRADNDEGKVGIKRWLDHHGFPFIQLSYIINKKPNADIFIDDRGCRFEGDFDEIKETLNDVRPWYKK